VRAVEDVKARGGELPFRPADATAARAGPRERGADPRQATSPAEARWLAEHGVDAVIAQGWEAGGHAGRFLPADPSTHMGTLALVPQIVDAIRVPVIAAGGIADGRGVAAALMLGASAVQIGTAYLATPESWIGPVHRPDRERSAESDRLHQYLHRPAGAWIRHAACRAISARSAASRRPFPYAGDALANCARPIPPVSQQCGPGRPRGWRAAKGRKH
jgi:nitronate monooxygenase